MTSDGQSALQAQPLPRSDPEYPGELDRALGNHAPVCYTLGHRNLLALFCSERCPGDLIIKACVIATALRDASVSVISGFHSAVERECLRILLRGGQPVVVCPARSLERMRLPAEWRDPIRQGRLLLVSPFAVKQNRMTAALAAQRNEFVVALAHAVLIVYADPGGLCVPWPVQLTPIRCSCTATWTSSVPAILDAPEIDHAPGIRVMLILEGD